MSRISQRRQHAKAEPSAEYLQKRESIVAAAARVFQKLGYNRASMNDVAAEVGSDRASVYYYFKGKNEIFHAVIIDAIQHLVAAAERIVESDASGATKVRQLVTELMHAYTDHYPYLYVYVQEDMTKLVGDDESTRTLREQARMFNRAVGQMIAAGIDTGEFKPQLDAELVANLVLGALNWSHRWYKPGGAATPEEITDVFVEVFLHGVMAHGLEPE